MAEKRLPDSKYNAKYPYNQTHISRSGHEKHIDDTPGHERIREGHKSGTYWEVTENGQKVTLVVADEYHYVKGGLTLTIDNNHDILMRGSFRQVIKGDVYQEIGGDSYTIVKGDSTNITLGDSVTMVGGDSFTKVKGSMHASVNGSLNVEAKGNAEISVSGDAALVTGGDIDLEGRRIRINAVDGPVTIIGSTILTVERGNNS